MSLTSLIRQAILWLNPKRKILNYVMASKVNPLTP